MPAFATRFRNLAMFHFLQRISVFLLIYLLLAGLLIAISIANGVLTILKVSQGSLGSLPKFSVKVSGWFGCGTFHICSSICVHHNICSSQGGLGVGLSHMILTLLVSVYFWIVVFSHR